MATPIGALRAELSATAARFEQDMGRARKAVQDEGTRMQRVFGKAKSAGENLVKSIFSVRTAAVAAAGVGGLFALTKSAIAVGDEIGKTSAKLGISAEQLQEFRFAAGRAGVASSTLDMALQRFTRRVAEAAQGTGEAKEALQVLGITLKDESGNIRSTEALLADVADSFAAVEDPAQRLRLAFKLFDSEGVAMVNMLADGSKALADVRQKARDLGVVISNDMVARAEVANDELSDMSEVFRVAGLNMALEFMPALQKVAGIFTSREFTSGVATVGAELANTIDWMVRNIDIVERFAKAYVGIMIGSRIGALAGRKGAVAGGIAGGLMGAFGKELMEFMETMGFGVTSAEASPLKEGERGSVTLSPEFEQQLAERRRRIAEHLRLLADMNDQKANEAAAKEREAAEKKLADLDLFLAGERSRYEAARMEEMLRHEERLAWLDEAREQEVVSTEEYHARLEELEATHQDRLLAIEQEAIDARAQMVTNARQAALNEAASLFNMLGSKSRAAALAALALNKGLMIAQAVQNTAAAATRALAELGPVAGPPAAAAIKAYGAAQIGIIAATGLLQASNIGGGKPSVSSGASRTQATSPDERGGDSLPNEKRLLIEFQGDVPPEQRELMETIIEAQRNGYHVVLANQ